ncbi:Crp/Fnr family transcriptional regulator [Insolitispirillum peregrinum]|uniref:Crp/Fnr family transcriptional regulator n=1 Tax=Insolitispirillum peregrinum TaxID=80876 RepID=UPI003615C378
MIPADVLHRVAAWSRALEPRAFERARAGVQERSYPAGSEICAHGQPFDYWGGVIEGLIKLRTLSADGKEVTLAGVHAGGWFGEGSVLKGEPRRYQVIALRETRLALLDRASFLWLMEHSTAFNRFLVHQLNDRLGFFMAMVEHDRMLDTTGRVAQALAALLNPVLYPDVNHRLTITQEEVGQLAGVSRPIANRALKALDAAGILRVEYGEIDVLDPDRLRSYGHLS